MASRVAGKRKRNSRKDRKVRKTKEGSIDEWQVVVL
jgi:hypothetical protein